MRLSHFQEENAYRISNCSENSSSEKEEQATSDARTLNSHSEPTDQRDTATDSKETATGGKVNSSPVMTTDKGKEGISNGVVLSGEEEGRSAPFTLSHQNSSDCVRPCSLDVPPSSQCEAAETDSEVTRKAPTEVMSPRSYSVFKSSLVHIPEMNLPWESMRNTSQCACGVSFSFSTRKVGA